LEKGWRVTYSEYGNKTEYKIVVANKKYFFREALKLYSDKYDDKESISYKKSLKIIENILSVLKDMDFEIDSQKKIIFKMPIIMALAEKDFLAKNSKLTASIIEFCRKKRVISRYSKSFVSIHKDYDSNRLTDCFSASNFNKIDAILDIRDELLFAIQDPNNESHEQYLYFYMKLFSIKKYPQEVFENFRRNNIFDLNGTVVLIYRKVYSSEYTSVRVIYFDEELNHALKKAFFNQSDNLLNQIDHYFEKPFSYYEKDMQNFLKNKYQIITVNDLNEFRKRSLQKMITREIGLDYQLESMPLHYTLQKETLYPHTNYLELVALFPDILKNQEYIAIELDNIKKQRQHTIVEEEDIEELTIKEYLDLELSAYEKFREFKQYSKVDSKKDHQAYVAKLDKFILQNADSFKFPHMFHYVKYLVSQSKFDENSKEKFAVSTVYGKLCILYAHCFNIIVHEGRIDLDVQETIKNRIENFVDEDTKSKYYAVINPFLDLFGFAIDYNNKNAIRYARRSLIFKKELDKFFVITTKQDSELHSLNTLIVARRVVVYQRFVFCMLLYYTGLRESELWSRTVKDVFIKENGDIIIDVNRNEIVKSFKTYSARRRVEFTIDDQKYFEIFQEYLQYLEENRVKYLFPKISGTKKFLKKEIQDLEYFLKSADILKEITNRYVSLHSFRHTFVTKSIRSLLLKEKIEKNDFYNIVNMVGHLGPEVTLRYYAHIDYILHFQNIENLF